MKHFNLVLTLVLLASLVATTAFAGGIGGVKGTNTIQGRNQVQRLDIKTADVTADRPTNSGASVRVDAAFSSPVPEAINASALLKYPQVSAAGLSGTYTIPGDFPTLGAAIAVLNFVGLDGDATFELTSASYSEIASSVTIGGAYPGAGVYNLTITPTLGVDATVTFVANATAGKGLAFNGARNITVDGVDDDSTSLTFAIDGTIFPTSDAFGSTVYITGGSDAISVKNVTVEGVVNNPVWENQTEGRSAAFVFSGNADPAENTNIEFDNVTFINGTFGLKVFPEDAFIPVIGLIVNNCKFGGAFGGRLVVGAWTDYAQDVTWTNNQFKDLYWLDIYWNIYNTEYAPENAFYGAGSDIFYDMGQLTAFHHIAMLTGEVAYNVIDGLSGDYSPGTISYGTRIYAYSGSYPSLVHHNTIQNIFVDHPGQSLTGIRGPATYVYHNTVRLTGAIANGWGSTCLNGTTLAYNNVFSNEMTGSPASAIRGVTAGGDIDYNAIYSTGYPVTSRATVNAAIAAGVNPHGLYGPVGTFDGTLHITGGASTAKEIGKPGVLLANDIDGTPIDTTFAGLRDAGADQFSPLGSYAAADVFPGALITPPAGVPVGVGQVPSATIKNNSQTPASFNVSLTSTDGYSDTQPVSLLANEGKTVNFASWTPLVPGPVTFTVTTLLGGDAVPGNDVAVGVSTAQAPVVPPAVYTFDASAEGWTPAIDWVRSSTFTKLGGVNGGSGASWVTERPTDPSTYTEGAYASTEGYGANYPGANLLTSPWLDISGLGASDLYISFQHSIETEPLWDRSWLQYTVDGLTWNDIGVLNDPDGINWYNEDLYEHAALDPDNFDDATLVGLYGIPVPAATWTSNDNGTTGAPGDFVPNGPSGWVYAQLHLTSATYPAVVGATAIRFRYIAFSDAVSTFGGWAFDNFGLSGTPPSFTGGTISGHAWTDIDGDGTDNAEADITATKVYVSLFGAVIDSVVTDGAGDYTWSGVTLPAAYALQLDVTGTAYTVPYGVSGVANINHPSDGSTIVQDFGTYVGSVSGMKFNDLDDDGVNDTEPGLAGWTIQLHKDSVAGELIGSAVTDVNGDYTIYAPPYGSYVVSEVAAAATRQTYPTANDGTHLVSISGTSGGAGAVYTGLDFGNFLYGNLRVTLTVDLNGNGVKDISDALPVPAPFNSTFKVTKDGDGFTADSVFVLGSGTFFKNFSNLDAGVYVVTEEATTPGWLRTSPTGTFTFTLNQSGLNDTAVYLDFQYITISGQKFDDLNGNGVKDGGEPGLDGWTVGVTGGTYDGDATAVTAGGGLYSIDSVGPGTHTVAEVAQAGWTLTVPGAGYYTVNGIGNLGTAPNKDFGNFADATVSGVVYRDYNGNGTMDPEDTPMSGVTVDLAVNGGSDVSDGSGYSFVGLITDDTVRVTVPGGFVLTDPVAGEYLVSLVSGGTFAGNFGLFQSTDSATKYRTFTAEQYGADDQKKAMKAPKAGKAYDPVKNKPTTAYMVQSLIDPKKGLGYTVQVGLPGQMNAGGKEKGYFYPGKQGDFWKSLNNKSVHHTGMARGFDLDLKGKTILKRLKSFPPNKKQNNKLFGELAALNMNLLASGVTTPAGLGTLIYSDPLSSLDGMTIDEIAARADTVMTNFEFMPLGIYTELDSVAAKINAAFSAVAVDDTALGWSAFPGAPYPTLTWAAYTSVQDVPFLKPNPGVSPVNRHIRTEQEVPSAFALEQNYPNPFNPTTTIEFDLPDESIVTLKIYNLLGQEVATLLDREIMDLGDAVEFDASTLPSGVYLYRIVAETIVDAESGDAPETFTQVKKMVLLK